MNFFIRNIGLIILLVGVIIIGITSIGTIQSNTGLWVGAIITVIGLLTYILVNKRLNW